MSKILTFTTKANKDATDSVKVSVEMPTDSSETDLIAARYGSEARGWDLAANAFKVDAARIVRPMLPENGKVSEDLREQVQAAVEEYVDNGRKSAAKPVVRVPDMDFDEEQRQAIRDSNPGSTVIFTEA